ncbi:MAG: hypothetical protein IT371_26985 [Deltaproteobacteria bacterium]|nr:hypothetical protein [Deltaproteobacteria bacterium]
MATLPKLAREAARLRRVGFALGVSLLAAACGAEGLPGGAALGVSVKGLSAADVTRVTVTVTGGGIGTPIVQNLALTAGVWRGTIAKIPSGTNRTFAAQAANAAGTVLYEGQLSGVTIATGSTAVVTLLLQQKTPPLPFGNSVPVIDGLFASSNAVAPGTPVSLSLAAHDPDPADALRFTWSASGGVFNDLGAAAPLWTAPATEGPVTLAVTVSDGRGGDVTLSFGIDVSFAHAKGAARIEAGFNTWPVVASLLATPSRLDVGESTTLTLTASDGDSDTLTFAWADGGGACAGSFSSPSVQNPTWTAPATLPPSGDCTLAVTVSDGRGGTTTGSLRLSVSAPPPVNLAPAIGASFQSTTSIVPGATVSFWVEAQDPEGQPITFAWSASSGAMGTATSTATRSDASWTAPATGCAHTVTATITDAAGASATRSFAVSTCP